MGGVQTFIGARDQDRSSQCDANDLRRLRGSVKHPLTALPGVTGVKVSLPRNRVELQFDENRLTFDAMRAALHCTGDDVATAPARAAHRGELLFMTLGRCFWRSAG